MDNLFDEKKVLSDKETFDKLNEVVETLTNLLATDMGSPMTGIIQQLKNDIIEIHHGVCDIWDGLTVAEEMMVEKSEEIEKLNYIIKIKEQERQAWFQLAIKKQRIINDLTNKT